MLRQTIKTLTLTAVLALSVGTAAANAAAISITGPSTGTQFEDVALKVGVDPSGLPAEQSQVYVAIYATTGTCPANLSTAPANPQFGRFVTPSEGPQVFDFPYDARDAGNITLCGYIAPFSTSPDTIATTTKTIAVKKADTRNTVSITAAWGQTASGKCRVSGDVTPRGTGKLKLQRRTGSSWTTVKSISIKGTKYVTTFSAKNGQRYRLSYAGSGELKPGVSLTHRISKSSKYSC